MEERGGLKVNERMLNVISVVSSFFPVGERDLKRFVQTGIDARYFAEIFPFSIVRYKFDKDHSSVQLVISFSRYVIGVFIVEYYN